VIARHGRVNARVGDADFRNLQLLSQGIWMVSVAGAFLVWWILKRWFFIDFSPFSYWNNGGEFWSVLRIIVIPPALYAIGMGLIELVTDHKQEESVFFSEKMSFKYLTSFLAGLWEELGHRGIFIYFGLIAVYLSNMFFLWILALIFLILYIAVVNQIKSGIAAVFLLAAVVGLWFFIRSVSGGNPVYAINGFILSIYQWVAADQAATFIIYALIMGLCLIFTAWIISRQQAFKLGWLELVLHMGIFAVWACYVLPKAIGVLSNPPIVPLEADKWTALLYIGAIMWSNTKFSDAHEYQGPAGKFNSYLFGLYMFYIAFTYGLLYAIIVHFLYDAIYFTAEQLSWMVKNRLFA
jgi:hypothetical protein